MTDELDRYKRLLDEWSAGAQNKPKPEPAQPSTFKPQPQPGAAPERPRAKLGPAPGAEEAGRYPGGTILVLDDAELVVYRRPVKDQPYDMVYSLLADGSIKIEAVDFSKHTISEMGVLTADEVRSLQSQMHWTRPMIAARCRKPEDAERIPEPSGTPGSDGPRSAPPPSAPAFEQRLSPVGYRSSTQEDKSNGAPPPPPPPPPTRPAAASSGKKTTLRRGQRIRLMFGHKSWEAIYWGQDHKGPVVAHNTHHHWTLMHLDLARFKESIIIESEPDPRLIEEILHQLATREDPI